MSENQYKLRFRGPGFDVATPATDHATWSLLANDAIAGDQALFDADAIAEFGVVYSSKGSVMRALCLAAVAEIVDV